MGVNHSQRFNLKHSLAFERVDETEDEYFYSDPRLVVHVDDHFIATLGKYFAAHLPPQAQILDLMSSYKSHLPADYKAAKVVGLGMNEAELRANTQLTEYVVQNLNKEPKLPFPDASFEVVLNTVSVQYLTNPIEIFREARRVLKPGGVYIVSFSNRMFPTKAVRIWRDLLETGRVRLVQQYFEEAGVFEPAELFEEVDARHHSGSIFAQLFNAKDPVYILSAKKRLM